MQKVLVIGQDPRAEKLLQQLIELPQMQIEVIINNSGQSTIEQFIKEQPILYFASIDEVDLFAYDYILDMTVDDTVQKKLQQLSLNAIVLSADDAERLIRLLQQREMVYRKTESMIFKQKEMLNSIEEGMIGINRAGSIDFLNQSAARMLQVLPEKVVGQSIFSVIPTSGLVRVFETGIAELNDELQLTTGIKIVSSRYPLYNKEGMRVGAFALFKDVSEIVKLAEEVTDLKQVKTMLEAIIHSSDDAISVVDAEGKGILINPAYTRLTGLQEHEVIGQPATVDIHDGESIHFQVLDSGEPMRGIPVRIGEDLREVVANVAPIIVDTEIVGSVGVIHDLTEIRALMDELDRAKAKIRKLELTYTFEDLVGQSTDMTVAIAQGKVAATMNAPVLIRGEAGTGKGLLASAIHSSSDRKNEPFIRVNCARIDAQELEMALFGQKCESVEHSFSPMRKGLFEEAENGTLLLDEVTELSANTQAQLRSYLTSENARFSPNSVRLMMTTTKKIEKEVFTGKFDEKLFYLINRLSIQLTPLRERKEDIRLIAEHLLSKLNLEFGMSVQSIDQAAIKVLESLQWHGNVRELENVLSRAMMYLEDGNRVLQKDDIEKSLLTTDRQRVTFTFDKSNLATLMDAYEQTILENVLEEHKGNKSSAAAQLGISVRSLYYKLEKYHFI